MRGPAAQLLGIALLVGCGVSGDAASAAPSVWVYAASSAADVAEEVSRELRLRSDLGRLDIRHSSAGSQTLRIQIEGGAAADVFLSADAEHMGALAEAGLVRDVRAFAYNALALVVPASNPAGIESLYDLVKAERLVIGSEAVPVGRYTREMLRRAAAARPPAAGEAPFDALVMERVVSQESNVRLVRAKVELGEADAAIVYRTDARGRPDLRMIPIPPEADVLAEYRVGIVVRDGEPEEGPTPAERWVDFLLSDGGRQVLARHGFVPPR